MATSTAMAMPPSIDPHLKATISLHPLYPRLLAAHLACLRIVHPVPVIRAHIDAQSSLLHGDDHDEQLDQFMTHYMLLLWTFKEQLQQHLWEHVMACSELEQSFESLTGIKPEEVACATMSDDHDDQVNTNLDSFNGSLAGVHDSRNFGPRMPTETERSAIDRVRLELKNELKTGYTERIIDVREEILRKRRAGKLSCHSTSVLKSWWHSHLKWPYPAEDEKIRLVEETGLQSKQINNWFINQRKRNWHDHPLPVAQKTKRKR